MAHSEVGDPIRVSSSMFAGYLHACLEYWGVLIHRVAEAYEVELEPAEREPSREAGN